MIKVRTIILAMCVCTAIALAGVTLTNNSPDASELAALSNPAADCLNEIVCPVGDRGYHVRVPDNWDGESRLPVLMHFHGWKRQGTLIVKHRRIAGATRESGVLLVAPNGLRGSWNFWTAETDDVDFASAVLEDVAKRFPIDEDRLYVSGYSYGSAMAWRFACREGARIAAVLAISGTLPDQSEDCVAPVNIRHVHGRSDRVMDFPFGPDGDETYPVSLWRAKNECAPNPASKTEWAVTEKDNFTRYVWPDCASGKSVTLDVHDRGHFIPVGWIKEQLDQILSGPAKS